MPTAWYIEGEEMIIYLWGGVKGAGRWTGYTHLEQNGMGGKERTVCWIWCHSPRRLDRAICIRRWGFVRHFNWSFIANSLYQNGKEFMIISFRGIYLLWTCIEVELITWYNLHCANNEDVQLHQFLPEVFKRRLSKWADYMKFQV